MSNPDVVEFGGRFYIYTCLIPSPRGSRWFVWEAEALEGPYTMHPEPVTDLERYVEDINVFVWDGRLYAVLDDNTGFYTGIPGAGLIIASDDPRRFRLADAKIAFGWILDYHRPSHLDMNIIGMWTPKFERPAFLLVGGKPAYFYAPCRANVRRGVVHENYVLKIRTAEF